MMTPDNQPRHLPKAPSAKRGTLTQCIKRIPCLMITLMLLSACALPESKAPHTPPTQRGAPLPIQAAWPDNHYLALAWHDVEDTDPDQTFVSVSTHHLQQQFAWLRENGYRPVSVDQILAAARGGPALPERAVLLSFDDGYRSFYDRVYPLLRAYHWPAVLAPVGVWVDPPAGAQVNFGGTPVPRERFLTWQQISEMSASGLVEIAAHTNNLHFGITANPQGNQQPAAAARRYDTATGRYESDAGYRQRIDIDVTAISQKIFKATGKPPRVWVWPYGTTSGLAAQVIQDRGYELLLTLDDGLASTHYPHHAPRLLIANDPSLAGFANAVVAHEKPETVRAVQVNIDDVADTDPGVADEKLGALIQQIADLQITTVILNAAHRGAPGSNPEVWFPNRHLPVRADLLNRVAWQLRSRAFVDVYTWLPSNLTGTSEASARTLADLYEDMARYAIFAGIVIDEPAHLDNQENASLQPFLTAQIRQDETRRSPSLIEEIKSRVKAQRGGETRVVRWLRLAPDMKLAQEKYRIDQAIEHADWVMVSPGKISDPSRLTALASLANAVTSPERLVITLDPDQTLASQMRQLQARGVRNIAYTPDHINPAAPDLMQIRPVLSNAWFPAK